MPTGFDSAFITNHFGFLQGFAYLQIENHPLPDSDREMDLSLVGIVENLRLGARLSDWAGLFASIEGQVLSGADPGSALFHGAGASLTWEAGLAVRILRDKQHGVQLTVRLKVQDKTGMDVTPITLAQALMDDAEQTAEDIVDEGLDEVILSGEKSHVFGGSLALAKAFGRHLGAQLGIEGLFGGASYRTAYMDGEIATATEREVIGLGTTFTGDLFPIAPLGLAVEYRYRRLFEQVTEGEVANINTSRHFFGAGFYYTGRDDLMLGFYGSEGLWRGSKEPERYYYAQIVIQYFF